MRGLRFSSFTYLVQNHRNSHHFLSPRSDDLPYIFDAFHQSKSSSQGHGLGLASVKAIIQAHGGRVAVKSNSGQGTTFIIRIPKN
ncbi:MAG: HAMP domain-containing histidine kinase [Proteobacteria bacterium]|nr:HAMP domain-containing histidine kinase [Pseudomonadota bacterium]MBU1685809.1 HAMP domain-containing histidine kinase [Pseudomonadota bacterium]